MAIGVGLDHRHDVATWGQRLSKLGQIVYERRQIYDGDGWKKGRRIRHAIQARIRKSDSDLHDFLFLFFDHIIDFLAILFDQLLGLLLGLAQFVLGEL